MRAIGYTRVSTQEQADSGLSLEAQQERIAAYCLAKNWTLTEVVTDAGVTGQKLDRPGLSRVLELVRRRQVDVVVTLKLDRLTRRVRDLCDLVERFERADVAFSTVMDSFDTTCANGRLVLNVLASVAQWEAEAIAERTSAAMQVARSQGRRVGAVPFGFSLADDGATLEPDPAELETVASIADLRRDGGTLRGIARTLNAVGTRTANAATWSAEQVRRVLRNDLYAGYVEGFVPESRRREAAVA
jgi:DNA invertase Pin-like site-specific DNA recombinase